MFRAMSRTMKALLGVWIAALVVAAGWIGWDVTQGGKPSIGGPFQLIDQDGRPFSSDQLKGKPTLIYFGFTYCPDVCPTSLLLMETAIEKLGPDAAKKVNLVFITVDPERDTPELLKGYVPNFGPTIIGLTGTPQQIADVTRAYRVYAQKVPARTARPTSWITPRSSTCWTATAASLPTSPMTPRPKRWPRPWSAFFKSLFSNNCCVAIWT
jgi:protein SCO1/2